MGWLPAVKVDVTHLAAPLVRETLVQLEEMALPLSVKLTVPLGVGLPEEGADTVSVNVT